MLVVLVLGGCLLRPRTLADTSVIESGDATIYKLDRAWLPKASSSEFEVQPGGHTVDVTASVSIPIPFGVRVYRSELTSLCVKARAGHRYRIRAKVRNDRIQLFFVDASTGQPPKTPCGPDEDDD